MADAIKRDMEASERFGKVSLFLAVRIGLALTIVKDNAPHGTLARFIEAHFAETTRRSLTNYMRVAGLFLTEAKLRDSRFRLSNPAAVAPILEEQLDLFTSPQAAKMEGVLKKLVQWAGKRSLQDIYKALAKGERSTPPVNHGNAGARNHRLPTAKRRELAQQGMAGLQAFLGSETWDALEDDELAHLDTMLGQFHDKVGALIKSRTRKGGSR